MKTRFICLFIFFVYTASAQTSRYGVANAHSHNDDAQDIPFWKAYNEGFGAVEVDVSLAGNELLVGHEAKHGQSGRTLETMYLLPLLGCMEKNNGYVFADSSKQLQLLIDMKTDSIGTLNRLVELLKKYPSLTANPSLKFVITGKRPEETMFTAYPPFIWFDGNLLKTYSKVALTRIAMLSDDFTRYSNWNGKGILPQKERTALQAMISKAHQVNKPVCFRAAPDFVNAWYQLMELQVDYISTNHIYELASLLNKLPANSFTTDSVYKAYQPTYETDGLNRPVKNVILLIGDGTGLAQLYAGYTANKGSLNIFKMENIGLSKTSSYDSYITDSAPGSTAFSAGVKTNNRFVGVDHTGAPLTLLPVLLQKKKIKTGLITCGDITDATPADFYAHQSERGDALKIIRDLKDAPVEILMGSDDESHDKVGLLNEPGREKINDAVIQQLSPPYKVVNTIDSITVDNSKRWVVIEKKAGLPVLEGRGDWLLKAFDKTVHLLSRNKEGFFLMAEGAQVDYGGHANSLPYVATEVMDFDRVVGEALRFADKNRETLVIVTADHETGGLSLLAGDYNKGYVSGQFSTNDHTAVPVPVFAYGPQSFRFRGVYENTALFGKILQAFGIAVP